jgi:hypothetical protein
MIDSTIIVKTTDSRSLDAGFLGKINLLTIKRTIKRKAAI